MVKMAETVLDLDQQIEELGRQRDAKVKAAAAKRQADHERLLRDPNERRRRLALLEQRKQEGAALQTAIEQLEAQVRDPSQALADLETGTVEEQVKKLRTWIVDPPPKRLERLKGQRKQLPAIDSLWESFMECCPAVARLLDDLKREAGKQLQGTQEGRQQDRDAAQRRLKDLAAALALNDDGDAIILLEEAPARLTALRRKYDLDPEPAALPSNTPVAEIQQAMSRENSAAILRR
jgi:hypothetical protein